MLTRLVGPKRKMAFEYLKNERIKKSNPEYIRCFYSIRIASAGQTSTQVWQSTHISLSTLALSFSMAIADAGHSLTQVSHPVHLLLSTMATNSFTPSYMLGKREKKGFDWYRKRLTHFCEIYAENEKFCQNEKEIR